MKILKNLALASIALAFIACADSKEIKTEKGSNLEEQIETIVEDILAQEIEESIDDINKPDDVSNETNEVVNPYIDYLKSDLENPRLKYYRKEKENTTAREWPSELWAILDGDREIQIPYPKGDADDIRIYALGDINGNGFEEIIIAVGGMGSCCLPNYTIASFDGNSFKLSRTMEWVETYEITEENGKTHFEFLLPQPNLRKEKYVYEDYELKPLKTQKAKTYKVIRELTIQEFFEHERSKSEEYLAMDYVKNDTEHLQIIALPETYKSLRFVLYNPLKDEMLLAYQIPDYASSIGVSEEMIDGYPVLVINNVYRLTKDGKLLNKDVEF